MNIQIIILKKNNITDFARERNLLLKKAKTEWILFLDTDETRMPALKKEIEALDGSDYNGFYIKRKIYFLGKHVGEDKVLRLGRKGAGEWRRAVHEVWDIKTKVGTLDNYLIHDTAVNLHDYIGKMNKYSDMHARENQKEGKNPSLFKIIFYPKMKFLQNFFAGRGVVFGILQAFHSYLSWSKLYFLRS
jgi:hypothetical protein